MKTLYFLNEDDYGETKEILEKAGVSFESVNQESKEKLPYLLFPLKEGKKLVIEVETETLPEAIQRQNEKRKAYLGKIKKANSLFLKGNLYGLIATFLILLAVGTAFFAIGFGMKQNGGYYAFLLLAVAILALSFYLIHLGASLFEEGREKKKNALSFLSAKNDQE